MWKIIGFLLVAILAVSADKPLRFDDYKVFNVFPETKEQYQMLKGVEKELDLKFWKEIRTTDEGCDIMVPPEQVTAFEELLQSAGIQYNLMIDNVQSLVDAGKPKSKDGSFNWTSFHTLDEINAWVENMAERHPQVTLFTFARSYEGRDIKAIKISHKKGNKAIFIDANIHACEWAASAIVTYIINQLLESNDQVVKDIAKNLDWIIVPVLNVDGFVYSHEVDRLWRKSRKPYDVNCVGADMNRNFDTFWMSVGASSDPCSSKYAGAYPESEPEVKQLADYIRTNQGDYIKIYLSLHSYAQLVLTSWGHTTDMPPDYDRMMYVASGFTEAANSLYGTPWNHGSSARTLQKVSGASKDWAYEKQNISISFTIELRDRGTYGFVMPPQEIIPTCEEAMAGLLGLIQKARDVEVIPAK